MFDQRLKNLREKQSLTQAQLANIIKLTQSTIAGYENGNKLPTIDTLIILAKYFNVSTDYLLGLSDKEQDVATDTDNYLYLYKDLQIYYDKLNVNYKSVVYDTIMTLLPKLYRIQELNSNSSQSPVDEDIIRELDEYEQELILKKRLIEKHSPSESKEAL